MKTLDDLVDDYILYLKSLNYSKYTVREYRERCMDFTKFLSSKHGVIQPNQLLIKHLKDWQLHLSICKTAKGLPLRPQTVNRRISNTRSLLKFMIKNGYIQSALLDVLEFVKTPKLLKTEVFSTEEYVEVINKIEIKDHFDYRNVCMLELLYSSGIRRGELQRLDIDDVNLTESSVKVFGKNSKERIVPVGKSALKRIETYLRTIRCFFVKDPRERSLFLSKRGKRMSNDAIRDVVKKHCDGKFNVHVTPHSFRRSMTTELVKNDANLYHVKEILGHESLDTLKYYAKLNINDLKKTHAKCHPREK